MRRHAAAFVLVVGLASLAGCGRAGAKVQTGIDYYEHGAYEGAIIKFRDVGPDEAKLRTKTHARYLVYRGLAHWHLAQTEDAKRYLDEARKLIATDGDPKWIPSDVRDELARAQVELGMSAPILPPPKGKDAPIAPPSSPPDRPSPPGTPPGPPDGSPTPRADKPVDGSAPPAAPSSPTSSPSGSPPTPSLPPNTTPPPDMM